MGHFRKNLTDRQASVLAHYVGVLGFDTQKMHYFKSEEFLEDANGPIDIVIFEPTSEFKYFLITTAGLSAYRTSEDFAPVELFMILPKTWKTDFERAEFSWPVFFLRDIAYSIAKSSRGVFPPQVYATSDKNYLAGTDSIGGVLVFPEMTTLDLIEEKIDGLYTRFFQIVPINKNEKAKIEDVGLGNFIEFDLHNAEGPVLVVKDPQVKKGVTALDKIIEHNEKSLKGK